MITLRRTNTEDTNYHGLVKELDHDLAVTDGEDHAFYNQFNGSQDIKYVVIANLGERAVGCGAIKEFSPTTVEVKRMYVANDARGKGIAGKVLAELEKWAAELGFHRLILETGSRQIAAIRLYEKSGYLRMSENYAQYAGIENSICMEKSALTSP